MRPGVITMVMAQETGGTGGGSGQGAPTPVTAWAQAYTGALHGHRWPVHATPEVTVALLLDGIAQQYRLVRHPRTSRAARDRRGNYVYVPVVQAGSDRPVNQP